VQLSGKRLLALLPGVEKRRKVGDREALTDQLWSAIEALPDPDHQSDAKGPSKQAAVIAMLQRPEGATVEEVASAMGWQRHTVRGLFSGRLGDAVDPTALLLRRSKCETQLLLQGFAGGRQSRSISRRRSRAAALIAVGQRRFRPWRAAPKEVMDRQSDRLPRQTRCEGMRIKREIQMAASGGGQSIKASGMAARTGGTQTCNRHDSPTPKTPLTRGGRPHNFPPAERDAMGQATTKWHHHRCL
jgi:hypothetical protein